MKNRLFFLLLCISTIVFAQAPCPNIPLDEPAPVWEDGFYRYYVKLISENMLVSDFNKTDFINHIVVISNPSTEDVDFMNTSITEVEMAFPASQNEDLMKVALVVSTYEFQHDFLTAFTESIDCVEALGEPQLSLDDFTIKNGIKIYPNPLTENSKLFLSQNLGSTILSVYNVFGKLLYTKDLKNSSKLALEELHLKSGIYFFKIATDQGTFTKRVVKN